MPKQTFFNLKEKKKNKIISAATDEFSSKVYEQVNLSDIIKKAGIPRGSFYQYFTDKKDLYLYILDLIKEKKMSYLKDIFYAEDIPFLDLVEQLYDQGIQFAIAFPKYVKIFDKLLNNKNQIYDEIMKENLQFAIDYYAKCIERDKEKKRISNDIDTRTLAEIVSSLTTNVTIEHIDINNLEAGYKMMKERFHHILYILRKGVDQS
jgi:AcrR family transcriptional regulator